MGIMMIIWRLAIWAENLKWNVKNAKKHLMSIFTVFFISLQSKSSTEFEKNRSSVQFKGFRKEVPKRGSERRFRSGSTAKRRIQILQRSTHKSKRKRQQQHCG